VNNEQLPPLGNRSICDLFPNGGGGDSQTKPAKIGTAVPYFPKVPFEASHLSFGNANIVSYFRRIGDFSPDGFQTEHSLFCFGNRDHCLYSDISTYPWA
jgi:hypothetical protein